VSSKKNVNALLKAFRRTKY